VETSHQLCEGRFGVAVGVSLDKSSLANCSGSKWSKSIVSQALQSRIELFIATNGYHNQTTVRNACGGHLDSVLEVPAKYRSCKDTSKKAGDSG